MRPTFEGRYRVVGDGVPTPEAFVYDAEDLVHERPVTLVVLRPELAEDAEFVGAVRDQALRLAKPESTHPAITKTYECGVTDEGDVFVALEAVSGRSLREVLDERGPHDPATALGLAIRVGEALEMLHHGGVIHGELRSAALLVVKDSDGSETVKLTDILLTRARRTTRGVRLRDAALRPYLAPEQLSGTETTEATDVHGLGLFLGELLTAEVPRATPRSRRPPRGLPRAMVRIMAKALQPRVARRYSDISLMVNDMWTAESEIQKTPGTSVPTPLRSEGAVAARTSWSDVGKAAALVGGLVVLGVGAWAIQSDRIAPHFRPDVPEAPLAASPHVPNSAQSSPVTRTPMTPTPVTPTSVTPTSVTPTSVTPTSVTPTSVTPTSVTPTSVTPTPVTPTSVTPTPLPSSLPSVDAATPLSPPPPPIAEAAPSEVKMPPSSDRGAAARPSPRPVAKAQVAPRPRRADVPDAERRSADGDGAAIIDWLMKAPR